MGAVVGSGGSAEVGAERNAWLRARHDDERAVELEYWRGESCGRCCGSGGRRVSELPSVGESPRLEWVLAWPCERCCWRRCCGGGGAEEDEAAALPGGGPLRRAEAAAEAGEGVRWCERGGGGAERCPPPTRDGGGGAGCGCCGTPADMVWW
jgi:hypothetical protein